MNAEQKQQAKQLIADWMNVSKTSTPVVWFLNGDCMAVFLQELVDAPEHEPFGYFKPEPFGWTDCAETDDGAIALYTAPSEPSVPDGWIRAIDEAMVVHHIGIADRADGYEEAKKKLNELLAINSDIARDCSEAPADVARDAARYRWLRNPTTDPALVIDKRVGPSFWDYEYRAGDELDAAIDAAIEREKLKGQS